mmetsp:Transcript_8326/g.17657  ORF Transcript_8326/g.17657 Transcript_8326/m.17657 type:complete len:112 (-) Transcript_8326:46-381(-)
MIFQSRTNFTGRRKGFFEMEALIEEEEPPHVVLLLLLLLLIIVITILLDSRHCYRVLDLNKLTRPYVLKIARIPLTKHEYLARPRSPLASHKIYQALLSSYAPPPPPGGPP